MLIKRLKLHKFNRLALNHVEDFELIPSNLTIFTWGNGAGKSSILQQLNPLPNDFNKDFKEDGYKELEFVHNNSTYLVRESKNYYSILKDGEELNASNKKKMQEEIVNSVFGLNKQIMSVIYGTSTLTRMSPSERKYWISKISNIDYTYPTKVYNLIVERRRDIIAWKKLAINKSLELEKLLNQEEDIKSLEDTIAYLKEISKDIAIKIKNLTPVKLEDIEANLNTYSSALQKITVKTTGDEIISKLTKLKDLHQSCREKQSLIFKELNTIFKTMKPSEVTELKDKISILKNEIQTILPSSITEETVTGYVNGVLDVLEKSKGLYLTYTDNRDKLSQAEKVEVEEGLQDKVTELRFKINSLKELIDTYKYNKDLSLDCPKCGTYIKFEDKIKALEEDLLKQQKLFEEKSTILKKYIYYTNLMKHRDSIKTDIENIFILIVNRGYKIDIDTKDISSLVDNISVHYSLANSCIDKFKSIKEMEDKLSKQENLNNGSDLEDNKKKLEEQLQDITGKLVKLNEYIKEASESKTMFDLASKYRSLILEELSKVKHAKAYEVQEAKNSYYKDCLYLINDKVTELTDTLNKHKNIKSMLLQHQESLKVYDEDLKDYTVLMDILSPTTGLIAKSINSLITTVVNEMNTIINTVWRYKMKILPCDLTEGDLDYKFKVEVNDNFIVEDVCKLSSGMQEIVDLAFKLVFLRYSKLGNMPIILDEFGKTMDREHRINAFNLIDNVICKNFEQVFLVSHFEEMYGRFKNAKILSTLS